MRSIGRSKLRKAPRRERKRTVYVKGYCRAKPRPKSYGPRKDMPF